MWCVLNWIKLPWLQASQCRSVFVWLGAQLNGPLRNCRQIRWIRLSLQQCTADRWFRFWWNCITWALALFLFGLHHMSVARRSCSSICHFFNFYSLSFRFLRLFNLFLNFSSSSQPFAAFLLSSHLFLWSHTTILMLLSWCVIMVRTLTRCHLSNRALFRSILRQRFVHRIVIITFVHTIRSLVFVWTQDSHRILLASRSCEWWAAKCEFCLHCGGALGLTREC